MAVSASLERLQQLLPELFQPKLLLGSPYLRFKLTQNFTAFLSMEQVQESLLVAAEQITPLPNLPSSVLGLMNARSSVFCVIDLPHLLNFPPLPSNPQQYQVIVVRISSTVASSDSSEDVELLGFAVPRILGVTRLVPEDFQFPLGEVPENLVPFLFGCVLEGEQQIVVLDMQAIATAPALQII